ncbi:MAG: CHAT domain-containing protein [Spirulina sp. SIO3F2]|nr:CHAT domain-containing protein [Spirulina sp. SIO3F2]
MAQLPFRVSGAIALTLQCSIASIFFGTTPEAIAQSITAAPDGIGTLITIDGNTYQIQGGTQAGANLFHSFQDFGLSNGEIANFLSNPGISNIFGRVVGGNASIIDGLIQANPNLYLMNPAGIVFGANAQLNVGGDFFATTADQICFEGGCFNSVGLNDYSALLGNPTTLGFLQNQPGSLINAGTLAVQKGKSIHLSGGTVVNLGQIAAPGGMTTIAAIPGERRVRLSEPGNLLSLDVSEGVLSDGINPLVLPELLAAAPDNLNAKVIDAPLGNVVLDGGIAAGQIDLYAAGQVTPSDPNLIQGETRVVRFSESGENSTQAVFIDRRADHPDDLLYGAAAGTVSQIIEKDEKGISVISEQLAVISDSVGELESVAIVAEGNEGNFWLGSQWIRAENIADYATQLQTWGEALTTNADLLLYSCFTALGATGEALVASIAEMTGADVAASTDVTGSVNYGGDWELEYSSVSGSIESGNPFAAGTLTAWDGKLAVYTVGTATQTALETAITSANGNGQFDTIYFAPGVTSITLTSALSTISEDLKITGNGINVTIERSSASGTPNFRIFDISATNATIQNLTIQNGSVSGTGGGVNHTGTGTLTLNNVNISNNTSTGDGGGISSSGVNATVVLNNSTVSGNSSGPGGGGIVMGMGSTLTVANSIIANNSASSSGGGINSDRTVTITNSTISGNVAKAGGGVKVQTGPLTITNSTISGNQATGTGSNDGAGGILVQGGDADIVNSTVSGNSAAKVGGGIEMDMGNVTLLNSTIAFNTAANQGGGVYFNSSEDHDIHNTIIANNTAASGSDIHANLSNSSVQHSLITSTSGVSGLTLSNGVNGNIIGQDPLLGPLQNNGGSTQTHALARNSPAVNAGNNDLAIDTNNAKLTIDQNGNFRIFDLSVDIGAYELQEITTINVSSCDANVSCTPLTPIALSTSESIGDVNWDVAAEATEIKISNAYAGLTDQDLEYLSIGQIQAILKDIEQQTGVKPALLYINFGSSTVTAQTPISELLVASRFTEQLMNPELAQAFPANPDDPLQLILVTAQGDPMIKQPSGITRDLVMGQARRLRRSLNRVSGGQRYLDPAQALYDWLIRPLDPELERLQIHNLSIIADEGARSLPFAALHDGQQFLVEQYSSGLMPSLSLIDNRYRPLNEPRILAMGASEFVNQGPLPAVPLELALITQQQPRPAQLNAQFTAANLSRQARDRNFQVLHLATHANFRAGAPDAAYVQLWGQEQLQLNSFRELRLYEEPPLELLILSACETAIGDVDAELGFAGASLQAGVKSVLASLWQVSDLGTLALMADFYDQLADPDVTIKAEALRQAQLALLRGEVNLQSGVLGNTPLPPELARYANTDLTHPYYWSGFTLVGSPW